MRRRIILALLGLAAISALAGCGNSASSGPEATEVVAGFYPLAWAAEQVGGGDADVKNLTPAGAEPHDLELSVRDVERVRGADFVLYLGAGFQPALEEAARETDGEALDLLGGLELLPGEDEGHGLDPHVWLDPLRYAEVVERIGEALGETASAADVAARLRALDSEYERGLAGCERRELVTTHDAFGYLTERYGLEAISIAGIAPEAEPSPRDLERVASLVRERGVTTIFIESLLSPEIGEAVARETGAHTAVLNPLEGLTEDELERGEDYLSVMRTNLRALREGLGCG
ncbi:MAG TPA: metal ABC transporter substrate-binding protein [Gaiellaceae bacterium]|nr:metal ABC transporter substrate-binding protein [Gaiellaceae bacterium]